MLPATGEFGKPNWQQAKRPGLEKPGRPELKTNRAWWRGNTTENVVLESSNKALLADPQAARRIPAAMSDSAFADRLEAIARDIEIFVSNRRRMTLRIAKLVSEAHDLFLYRRDEGGFTGWMKARFNCSPSSAYRWLDVYKRFGDVNLSQIGKHCPTPRSTSSPGLRFHKKSSMKSPSAWPPVSSLPAPK
jgi:hypothetical protein